MTKELDTGKIVIKSTRTLDNVYILEGDNEHFYLRKSVKSWLWHKRLGHIHFSQLVKIGKKGVVCDMPNNIPIEINICNSYQFGK